MKILVTGATGYIGAPLVRALVTRGDTVTILTRDPSRAQQQLGAGVHAIAAELDSRGDWWSAVAGQHAIVHLAGEPVADKRWDARQKQIIRDSRVESTRGLVEAIAATPVASRPTVLVHASGIDYYPWAAKDGFTEDDEVTEADPPGEEFLARVCRDWEREARAAEAHRLRVCAFRIGVVVGPGGPVAKMATPFKLFGGGKIGNGQQWMSWISLPDIVALFVAALADERYTGAFNAVAPEVVRNRELARALGHALGRPSWLPVPGFALRAAVGEFAEVLLHGRRAVPARLQALSYEFIHPQLAPALAAAFASGPGRG